MTDFDPTDLLSSIFRVERSDEEKRRNPIRSDFDVPLPIATRVWLARITAKHQGRSA